LPLNSSTQVPHESTRRLVARLGTNSGIYAVGNALARGAPLLLVPVFGLYLSPADYGVLAVATALSSLLSFMFSLSLDSAISAMYFHLPSPEARAELNASLFVCWVVFGGGAAVSLHVAGTYGLLEFIPSVPFRPYLRAVIWTAYFTVFVSAIQTLFATLEKPIRAVVVGLAQMVITIAASIYFVVVRKQGAEGSINANLLSALLAGGYSIVSLALLSRHRPSWTLLKRALLFTLPLVPHVAATWILNLSDRTILQKFVSESNVGIYALGYQVGSVMMMLNQGISFAAAPVFNSQMTTEAGRERVPRLGTYAILVTIAAGLAVALLGGDALMLVTPTRYHDAARVVPWVAAGCTFQGIYITWSRGTWFSMKTKWVPALTGVAALANVLLNLLLIPRFGYMAAAVNTMLAFALLAFLHGYLAHKVFPVAWEYSRWRKIGFAAVATLLLGISLPIESAAVDFAVRALVLIVVFPAILFLLRMFTADEMSAVRRFHLRFLLSR